MPTIKNGHYADIVLLMEHTGGKQDKILEKKYYRIDDGGMYILYKSKKWYIQRSKDRFYSGCFETTGIIETINNIV